MNSAKCIYRSSTRHRASAVRSYGLAISSVAAALCFVLWQDLPALFFPAILVSAWYGGIGPGLLAAFLPILGRSFYLSPSDFGWGITNLTEAVYFLIWSLSAFCAARLTVRRREFEKALTLFRSLIDHSNDTIEVIDPDTGRILDVNQQASVAHGYTRAEYLALTVWDLVPKFAQRPWQEVREELQRVGTRVVESQHRRKDGSMFPVEVSVTYIHLDHDYLLAVVRDITERKLAEIKIIAYQEQLRSMASEISFVEERERHKIATALHDQVGQTLAMAAIKLGALRQAVVPGNLGGQVDEIREMISHAIRHSRTLTFELSPPILYDMGLEAAVCSLAERYQKEHGIRIDCSDDRRPKPLSDDMLILLFQGVRELLVNAVKHAHPQRITISCQREGSDIIIMVEDDGVGFATAEGETMTGKNYGFGLFSMRERLKYLGGNITIKSAPGRGTQVTLTAPLAVETEEKEGAA